MSKKPETLFSNQLIKNLNQVFFTRIENKHGGGIPDLYCTYNNKSAFLELKIKTKQNKLIISPLQISWNFKHFQQTQLIIIWLMIQGARSSNYTTATKGASS